MSTQPWEPRVSRLEAAFESINDRLADVNTTLDRRLGSVDKRIDGLDARVGRLETRFDRLETRFETRFERLETGMWRIVWIVLASAIATITAGFLHR